MEWKCHWPITKKNEFRDISNTNDIWFLMVYQTIIDVILHSFIICYDLWCQLPFRHNGNACFGKMPPMCHGYPDVNNGWGTDTAILRQHWPFMSIKSFLQHSGWQEMVSLCLLICFNWRVHWPRPARVPLFSLGLEVPRSPCSHSRRLLTHYRLREVRNLIYRYRKFISIIDQNLISIYIDYIDNLRQHCLL